MDLSRKNIKHVKQGDFIRQSKMKGATLSLLVQKQGLEVIHHQLEDGKYCLIGPMDGWTGFEFIYILTGCLTWNEQGTTHLARAGDYLMMDPIGEDTMFTAKGETSYLYISSQSMFDMLDEQVKQLMDLAVSVEEKDGYTADHCQRIMELSMQIGESLGLSSEELYQLQMGSFLHDIGKTKIPDEILLKPSKLTSAEYELMKKHALYGGEILRNSGLPVLVEAAKIVEQHHERFNGSGYPCGLKEDEILLAASIVAVVDSYDAMTSVRVYSQGRSKEEAIEEIKRERGRLFHPLVVDAFLALSSK